MSTYQERFNNAQERLNSAAKQANDSARDIWLAGLGAFSRAQEETGKAFDELVKAGEVYEKARRAELDKTVDSVKNNVEGRFDNVRKMANSNIEKIEKVFENQVARILARLGIPTADDINALAKRVQSLSKEVKALNSTKKAA